MSLLRKQIFALIGGTLLCLPGAVLAHEYRARQIEAVHPWARPTPPKVETGAGYLELVNHGKQDDRLLSVRCSCARAVEIHEMRSDASGTMRMRRVKELLLPAGARVALAPGGLHLMLFGLKQPLKAGERVKAELVFAKAGTLAIELLIESTSSHQDKSQSEPTHEHRH
jgi:periplasmic copper chaperone A